MEHRIDRHIRRLVSLELRESREYYETHFHSPHEAYAIIAEEFEEAEHELRKVRDKVESMWEDVKEDRIDLDFVANMTKVRIRAEYLASEAVQIAAMAQKTMDSIERW